MRPGLRRFMLTAHVTTTVGWLGAVLVFLALAVIGLTNRNAQTVRGVYLVMEPAAWSVLVPLALASLLTGLVMSLGTKWGLFRHYWVLFKLLITVFSTTILLVYMRTFALMAGVAADPAAGLSAVRNPSPALHATLAAILLIVATVLAIYKPTGLTPYGRNRHTKRLKGVLEREGEREPPTSELRRRYVLIGAIVLLLLIVVLHLAGGGIRGH